MDHKPETLPAHHTVRDGRVCHFRYWTSLGKVRRRSLAWSYLQRGGRVIQLTPPTLQDFNETALRPQLLHAGAVEM